MNQTNNDRKEQFAQYQENDTMKELLLPHKVHSAPESVYYIPEYLSIEQELHLIDQIYRQKWAVLSNRRLQNHGGIPHIKGMFAAPLPNYLRSICDELYDKYKIWSKKPNHVLVNEYLIKQGIDPHKDGPVYEPFVAIISLESTVLIEFVPDPFDTKYVDETGEPRVGVVDDRTPFSLILEPRSLFVFSDDVYHHYLHKIEHSEKIEIMNNKNIANIEQLANKDIKLNETTIERSRRISLTCRVVKKTISRSLIPLIK